MPKEDYSMPFGRHKGKTLEEISFEDPDYLDWFYKETDNGHTDQDAWVETVDAVREFLGKE